jgi:hypothetical protein
MDVLAYLLLILYAFQTAGFIILKGTAVRSPFNFILSCMVVSSSTGSRSAITHSTDAEELFEVTEQYATHKTQYICKQYIISHSNVNLNSYFR